MMRRTKWWIGTLWVGGVLAAGLTAQTERAGIYRRAIPPSPSQDRSANVFFADVFRELIGSRPERPADGPASPSAAPAKDAFALRASESGWATLISSTTLEDEVKSLKLKIDQLVTTPTSFSGRGHREARISFTLLAVLFTIIEQYEEEVRWRGEAATARRHFARVASNLKAGGSIQVYHEARGRQQDLDDLVRGARWQEVGKRDPQPDVAIERAPLMQLLENRLGAQLRAWTAGSSAFDEHREALRHEAELTAAVARILVTEGADDAEDIEYQTFARLLEQAAMGIVRGVADRDLGAAQQAMTAVSRSCVECHEWYR